jgi:hypothetical protein
MDQEKNELMSYCRQCGGERYHSVIAEKTRSWSEDDPAVEGSDTWSIVECGVCHTVTFIHSHWFSEDYDLTEDGPTPILHRDRYPAAPSRKMPEWGIDAFLCRTSDDLWIVKLHEDIYAAIGMEAYALAAMGARTIVDYVVTSKAGEEGNFKEKLYRMREQSLITDTQVEVIYAAFDAGSAAAHRGYSPTRMDVYTLLDITESLLQQIYIDPLRQRRQAKAAAVLKSNTPQRSKPKKAT